MYSFSYLEPVCCPMSSSNCCFLTRIQVFQEAGQVVWYSHLFQDFPQFIVMHTVKGFGIVNKAGIDVFLELSCFFDDPELLFKFALRSSEQIQEPESLFATNRKVTLRGSCAWEGPTASHLVSLLSCLQLKIIVCQSSILCSPSRPEHGLCALSLQQSWDRYTSKECQGWRLAVEV